MWDPQKLVLYKMHRTAKLSTHIHILSPLHKLFTSLHLSPRLFMCLSFSASLFSLSLYLYLSSPLLFLLLLLNLLSDSALKEFSFFFLLSSCLKSKVQTLKKLKPKFKYNPRSRTSISPFLSLWRSIFVSAKSEEEEERDLLHYFKCKSFQRCWTHFFRTTTKWKPKQMLRENESESKGEVKEKQKVGTCIPKELLVIN